MFSATLVGPEKHIPEELNPKFYSVHEFHVSFPGESLLTVCACTHPLAHICAP
jgi:hypothetical protein